jgi:hypothetical protein
MLLFIELSVQRAANLVVAGFALIIGIVIFGEGQFRNPKISGSDQLREKKSVRRINFLKRRAYDTIPLLQITSKLSVHQ